MNNNRRSFSSWNSIKCSRDAKFGSREAPLNCNFPLQDVLLGTHTICKMRENCCNHDASMEHGIYY